MPVINNFPIEGEYVDLVSDQEIDGQKDFIKVPQVKITNAVRIPIELRETYQQVEYIESTGTQYINTGITMNYNHWVSIEFELTEPGQQNRGIFGAYYTTSSTTTNKGRFGSILDNTGYLEHGYGNTNVYSKQGIPDTFKHTLFQKKK